jgi:ADP-heptose:LPS heptosyltransferase
MTNLRKNFMAPKKTISTKDSIKFFGIAKNTLEKLGMTNFRDQRTKFKTLEDVFNSDTGMVNGQCTADCSIKDYKLKKGTAYTMSFSIFIQGFKNKDQKTKNKTPFFKPYRQSFNSMFRRYRGQDLSNKRLLVSRFGGLGDLIVVQSTLKAIKDKFPTCHITFATNPDFQGLFNCFPKGIVDRVIGIPFETQELNKHDYHLLFINAIENCIETQKYNYYDIFQKVVNLDYNVDDYISTLIPIPEIKQELVQHLIPKNMIALHMESTTPLRRYPNELWKVMIDLLHKKGYTVGIINSKDKAGEVNNLILEMGVDTTKVLNLSLLSPSIEHGITIFDQAIGAVVIDSTFAHIAGALRKPAVAICGPYPAYNVVGRYPTVVGADKPGIEQQCEKEPCYYNSQVDQCPYLASGRYPICTSSISPDRIVELLEEQIKKFEK